MKQWQKVLSVTLLFGVAAFFLGPLIWPISKDFPAPAPGLIPYFILLSFFDSLFFGLGIAFIIFGWPVVQRMSNGSRRLGWALYLSIAFLLASWWPHINMHNATGFDLQGLLVIDYTFHVPLMIAGAIVAYGFMNLLRQVGPVPVKPATRQEAIAMPQALPQPPEVS